MILSKPSESCPAGKFENKDLGKCTECPVDMYSAETEGVCHSCTVGTRATAGAGKVEDCFGKYLRGIIHIQLITKL